MSSSLVSSGSLLPGKLDRRVARALAQIDAGELVAARRDAARLNRVASTTEHGMVRAAQLGALEATLAQNVPSAAGYVHAVATAGAMGIVAAVYEAGRGS